MLLRLLFLALATIVATSTAHAEGLSLRKLLLFDKTPDPADHVRLVGSPYTLHFNPSERHRPAWLLGIEKQYADGDLIGAAVFSNSFGQEAVTVYRGERYRHWSRWEPLYAQWAAGLMWGYRGEFQDEVPLNFRGFSPVLALTLGWQLSRQHAVQLNLFGTAALMLQFSLSLD